MKTHTLLALLVLLGLVGRAADAEEPSKTSGGAADRTEPVDNDQAATVRGWDARKKEKLESQAPAEAQHRQTPSTDFGTVLKAGAHKGSPVDPDKQGRVKVKLPAADPDDDTAEAVESNAARPKNVTLGRSQSASGS